MNPPDYTPDFDISINSSGKSSFSGLPPPAREHSPEMEAHTPLLCDSKPEELLYAPLESVMKVIPGYSEVLMNGQVRHNEMIRGRKIIDLSPIL